MTCSEGDSSIEQIADAYGLTTDEPAQHVDQSSTAAQIATTQDWWVSEGRESTLLYTFDREEILTLLEANGKQARAALSGSRAIPSAQPHAAAHTHGRGAPDSRAGGGGIALLLLDLARFKEVNNTFGQWHMTNSLTR